MKRRSLEKTFLEALAKTSNISIACEQVGLSRQSIYRWMKEDYKFRRKVEEALFIGVESINDLAESKLISNIKSGRQRPIEYWLNNHKKEYKKDRPEKYDKYNQKEKDNVITEIKYTVVKTHDEIKKLDELKKVRDELRELSKSDKYDD